MAKNSTSKRTNGIKLYRTEIPKKEKYRQKSVSKPKKEIKKSRLHFHPNIMKKAIEIVKRKRNYTSWDINALSPHLCNHSENGRRGTDWYRPSINLCQERSMERRQIRRIDEISYEDLENLWGKLYPKEEMR